VEIGQRPEA